MPPASRARAATLRRERAAAAWRGRRAVVLVPAGLPLAIAGSDQFHDFHAHADHSYLAASARPGAVLAFDRGEGWHLFVRLPSAEEAVWTGEGEPLDVIATQTGVERVEPLAHLGAWLERRRGEPIALAGNPDLAANPAGYGLEGWAALEPVLDEELGAAFTSILAEARRTKDPDEIALMRRAAEASRAGHLAGLRLARPGMSERDLQVEIEVEFFRTGSERTAYGSIVGSGPNGAVLHFTPTRRHLRDGDLVLVDAGAEVEGYASDVTRTYPAGRAFTPEQRDLYALVLSVQEAAIAAVRPAAEYRDLHLAAATALAEGLAGLGILRGHPEDLVERDAHALFFPHGLGHMLGLATHDAGGCLAGRERSERFGLKYLRADLPLQPGYVVTVEPGVYFIRALLQDPAHRAAYRDAVHWDRVDGMLDFGGIRIEDDVLVTEDGADVLSSAIPKEIEAIEAIRREAFAP